MKLALEIDSWEFGRDKEREFRDMLPHGARILSGQKWEDLARAEFSRGRTFRKPQRPLYMVVEWIGYRGKAGQLLDFLESKDFPITRYAELFE